MIFKAITKNAPQHCRRLFRQTSFTRHRYPVSASVALPTLNNGSITHAKAASASFDATQMSTSTSIIENDSEMDFFAGSSFEAALNQVLELQRNSPTATSHQASIETCVREFFRV
jgi:hypothetical protein